MQDGGVFAEVSLSGDILRISPDQFGKVIASLLTQKQAANLIARLSKEKKIDEPQLRAAIERLGTNLATEAVKQGAKAGVSHGFTALGNLFSGAGPDAFDQLVDVLG
jgi:hypothetical protein